MWRGLSVFAYLRSASLLLGQACIENEPLRLRGAARTLSGPSPHKPQQQSALLSRALTFLFSTHCPGFAHSFGHSLPCRCRHSSAPSPWSSRCFDSCPRPGRTAPAADTRGYSRGHRFDSGPNCVQFAGSCFLGISQRLHHIDRRHQPSVTYGVNNRRTVPHE